MAEVKVLQFSSGVTTTAPSEVAASASQAGVVTTGTQTFAGSKTFTSSPKVSLSGANGLRMLEDTGTSTNSARIFLEADTTNYSIMNSNNTFYVGYGATPGSSSGSPGLTVSSSGRVGVGATGIDAELHIVENGNVCTAVNSSADGICVQATNSAGSSAGISIITGESGTGYLMFDDSPNDGTSSSNRANIRYAHTLDVMAFRVAGADAMNIQSDGGIEMASLLNASTANTVYYNTTSKEISYSSSSSSAKENIRNMTVDTSPIYRLQAREFERKSNGETELGYVAEEVFEVIPRLAAKNTDGEFVGVWYQWLPIFIIEEMKKLRDRIEQLEGAK